MGKDKSRVSWMVSAVTSLAVTSLALAEAATGQSPLSFFLCDSMALCEAPESGGSYHDVNWSTGSRSWVHPTAFVEDVDGTEYVFNIYASSSGTTSFNAEILIGGELVASTSFVATSATFAVKGGTVTGLDPDITGNESLELRITHTGGSVGYVRWGDFGADDSFIRVPGGVSGIADVRRESVAWGDYDLDGDLDLLAAGRYVVSVYRNDGAGTFADIGLALPPLRDAAAAWGDADRDGDLDFVLTGFDEGDCPPCSVGRVFRNDGADTFTDLGPGLIPAIAFGAVDWGDGDNDGDLDLVLAGAGNSGRRSRFLRNDGGNVFTELDPNWVDVASSAFAGWADFDQDGDLDLALGGDTSSELVTRLYRNDGGAVFTDLGLAVEGLENGSSTGPSLAWGDSDADGDLDLVLCGHTAADGLVTRLYRNDGGGAFTLATLLVGVDFCVVAWGDHDGDGDLDLMVSGRGDSSVSKTYLYRNLGGNVFEAQSSVYPANQLSAAAWGDYDGDGRLDLVLSGLEVGVELHRNTSAAVNQPPSAPTGLAAAVMGGDVLLSWLAASDTETAPQALSYNLRVGSATGGVDVVSPMADVASGRRLLAARGPIQQTSARLTGLVAGRYFWSVQAIDSSFAGSPFATETSFLTEVCFGDDATGDGDGDGFCADRDCDDADPTASTLDGCGVCGGNCPLFSDGFESGNTIAWTVTVH